MFKRVLNKRGNNNNTTRATNPFDLISNVNNQISSTNTVSSFGHQTQTMQPQMMTNLGVVTPFDFMNTNSVYNAATNNQVINLQPMIYELEYRNPEELKRLATLNPNSKINKFNLKQSSYGIRFPLPSKLYGDIERTARDLRNRFKLLNYTNGVLLVGPTGVGKTELAKLLSNMMLEQDRLGVLLISGLDIYRTEDINELSNFLEALNNVVVFWDEFEKNISYSAQELLLTYFSNLNKRKRVNIITANVKNNISRYIYGGIGRIRYLKEYDKLSKDVIKEYCRDRDVPARFVGELIKIADAAKQFSFAHLEAIVDEKVSYPEKSLKEIINYLNIPELRTREVMVFYNVTDLENKVIDAVVEPKQFTLGALEAGLVIRVNITDKEYVKKIMEEETTNTNNQQTDQHPDTLNNQNTFFNNQNANNNYMSKLHLTLTIQNLIKLDKDNKQAVFKKPDTNVLVNFIIKDTSIMDNVI